MPCRVLLVHGDVPGLFAWWQEGTAHLAPGLISFRPRQTSLTFTVEVTEAELLNDSSRTEPPPVDGEAGFTTIEARGPAATVTISLPARYALQAMRQLIPG